MPLSVLEDIFKGPWGIVESRRAEIEGGGFGAFDRILNEEIERRFLNIEQAAQRMNCHTTTARKWLDSARFITHEGKNCFFLEDVEKAKARRIESKKSKVAAA